jgi:hypothetical protein
MDYFQIRKNVRQVIRISRGPYEGYDVTRLQIWYKDASEGHYRPGRTVAFNSELIPGIMEGLERMARQEPRVSMRGLGCTDAPAEAVHRIMKAHGRPLHWEVLSDIVSKEHPEVRGSKWAIYNTLLGHAELFEQVDEDVFAVSS